MWIDAPSQASEAGSFTAFVNISYVDKFDSANYDVIYNASVIQVTNVINGSINGTAVTVDDWGFIPPGVQGVVRIINNLPGVSGVSGSGVLAKIAFDVVGQAGDTSQLDLSNGVVYDIDANEITVTAWINDSIDIVP